jgi:hypothetical protein
MAVEHRRAQLVDTGEGELHLRLDADDSLDAMLRRTRCQVFEQSGLAHPRFASYHEHLSLAGGNTGSQSLKGFALSATAVQEWLVMIRQANSSVLESEPTPTSIPSDADAEPLSTLLTRDLSHGSVGSTDHSLITGFPTARRDQRHRERGVGETPGTHHHASGVASTK